MVNEGNAIRGNTVLKPEYLPSIEQENEKKRLKERAKNKRLKQKRVKNKFKIIRNIVFSFIIGVTLVGRYCIIYNMQKELNSIKFNTNEMNNENENLKVELVKYNNIQYIEEFAVNKLHMFSPDKGSAIYTDLNKENIKSIDKKNEKQAPKKIWEKLTKILF